MGRVDLTWRRIHIRSVKVTTVFVITTLRSVFSRASAKAEPMSVVTILKVQHCTSVDSVNNGQNG